MKTFLVTLLLFFPAITIPQGMNQEDMQKMMGQMQEMQTCMQSIDQNRLNALEAESKRFEAEAKGLCVEGKRDKAQEMAIAYGKKVINDPALIAMRKCTQKMHGVMQGMMPKMPYNNPQKKDFSKRHVCDM